MMVLVPMQVDGGEDELMFLYEHVFTTAQEALQRIDPVTGRRVLSDGCAVLAEWAGHDPT